MRKIIEYLSVEPSSGRYAIILVKSFICINRKHGNLERQKILNISKNKCFERNKCNIIIVNVIIMIVITTIIITVIVAVVVVVVV